MKSKDKAEKCFIACRDVFAEIFNVLVFRGAGNLSDQALQETFTESIYFGSDRKYHSQFRDFSMFYVENGVVNALYTLENQSGQDRRMPLRDAGYNGASYRSQYKRKKGQGIYPVISAVLNWGEKRWRAPCSIRGILDYPIPDGADDYVDKNEIHVFDMRFLDKETRQMFQGDMRIILDYLSDRESMLLRNQAIHNPEEVLRMLHALSKDDRYLQYIEPVVNKKGEKRMCDLIDEFEGRGIQTGIQKGIKALIMTCQELNVSFEDTINRIKSGFDLKDSEAQESMKLYWK